MIKPASPRIDVLPPPLSYRLGSGYEVIIMHYRVFIWVHVFVAATVPQKILSYPPDQTFSILCWQFLIRENRRQWLNFQHYSVENSIIGVSSVQNVWVRHYILKMNNEKITPASLMAFSKPLDGKLWIEFACRALHWLRKIMHYL